MGLPETISDLINSGTHVAQALVSAHGPAVRALQRVILGFSMSRQSLIAKRFFVRGRVQGVGFRWFVERVAADLGLTGYVRNLDDGRVEVYAVGPGEKISELNGLLWQGPRLSEVRGVEEQDAAVQQYGSFRLEI